MLSSATTIRNLFILLAALALATGCTTAKTLGTPVSAVAATPAPSSDTGAAEAAEPSVEAGTAEAAEVTTDTRYDGAYPYKEEPSTSDTGVAEAAEPSVEAGVAEAAEPSVEAGVAEAAEAKAPEPWTPSPLTLWVVHKGEHLWGISAHDKVYGDPYQWPLLFKRNRHQIEDADLIYPGQVLHIERDLSNAEIDRAIEHAKTRGAWILGITELTDLEYLSRERGYE